MLILLRQSKRIHLWRYIREYVPADLCSLSNHYNERGEIISANVSDFILEVANIYNDS